MPPTAGHNSSSAATPQAASAPSKPNASGLPLVHAVAGHAPPPTPHEVIGGEASTYTLYLPMTFLRCGSFHRQRQVRGLVTSGRAGRPRAMSSPRVRAGAKRDWKRVRGSTRPRSGCRSGDERDFHRDRAMPDDAASKPRQEARSESAPDRLGCVVLPIRKAVASTSRWRNDSIPPERRFPEDAARRRAACRPQCRWEIEIQLQVAARLGACPSNVLDGGGEG